MRKINAGTKLTNPAPHKILKEQNCVAVLFTNKTATKFINYHSEMNKTLIFRFVYISIIIPQTGSFLVLLRFCSFFRCRIFFARIRGRSIDIFSKIRNFVDFVQFLKHFVQFCSTFSTCLKQAEQKFSCTGQNFVCSRVGKWPS